MALGKMLNLGGIDNRPPKANQGMGRFRVARNVQPTPDGRIIPRYENASFSVVANTYEAMAIAQYNSDVLTLKAVNDTVTSQGIVYRLYKNTTEVPSAVFSPHILGSGVDSTYSQQVTSYRYNNTTYFQCPYEGYLLKYDGVELRKASCAQPIISSTDYLSTGTKFIRVIQHAMDFDSNEPCSEYVQFQTSVAATLNVNTAQTGTNLVGQTNVIPSSIISNNGIEEPYFIGTATYNAGTQDFTLSSTGNLANFADRIGSYVFVSATKLTTAATGVGFDTYGVALKIKSVSPVRLDATNAYVMNTNRDWLLTNVSGASFAASITYGTKTYFSFWESTSSNGIYYYRDIKPSFPSGASSYPTTIAVTGVLTASSGSDTNMFSISSILNYWYATESKKIDINSLYNFGGENPKGFFGAGGRPFYCMTVYQDVLLLANDNGIYFSDTTNGGSFEQFLAGASLTIGNKEFGRITSICGTQDFLFVSRERKNYYVNGNILTNNYRVQEIVESELGAWSNNASLVIKDSVIFLNSLGVFQVMGGGRAVNLSEKCPKNFATYDSMNVNEDVVFQMSGYSSTIVDYDNQFTITDDGIAVAYDEFRELLVFCKKGKSQTGNPMLVLHTKTGEFYEWDGVLIGTYISEIGFILSKMYVGYSDYVNLQAGVYVEDRTINQRYFETNPAKLYSVWLTGGEPSLEKSLLQLKIFGRVQTIGSSSGLGVVSFKDWDYSTRITNTQYFPNDTSLTLNNQIQYSHKKRLNSDKVLAASVGIEIATNGNAPSLLTFELESIEVEFNTIQEGMKK